MRDFSYSKARTRDFTARRAQDSGGVGVGGLYLDVFCCLQVNGPVTEGTYKWGERGLIPGKGDLWPDVSFCCCFTGKWTCKWGNLYVGGGGLITGCIVLFTGKWAGNSVGALFSWGEGEAHKRKFTVFTTRDTYNSTH